MPPPLPSLTVCVPVCPQASVSVNVISGANLGAFAGPITVNCPGGPIPVTPSFPSYFPVSVQLYNGLQTGQCTLRLEYQEHSLY